jgi:hypothetical protein
LYGRKFTIVTDPLNWIFSVKDPSSRLLRWRLKLEEYEYEVVYKKGSSNTNANAFSRIHVTEEYTVGQETRLTKEEKQAIFEEMHDKPVGGHLGMNRIYDRMKLFTTWPGMKQELEQYIRQCETCQKNKITQKKTKMSMKITTPDVVWEKCALDIVRPLTETMERNKCFDISGRTV